MFKKLRNLLSVSLSVETETRVTEPRPPVLFVPFEIIPYDGGIHINGADEENTLIVGMTEAQDKDGVMREHECIVEEIDGTLERRDLNAHELLHSLAEILGYKLVAKAPSEM